MSERDDLIDLIDGATWSLIDSDAVADAILAAGWRAPKPHAHDWHQTGSDAWCQCGSTAKQHFGVWVITGG